MVHHCERLFHGEVRDEVEEPIVVEDDERVGATLKSLDPGAGVVHAAPFRPERRRGQGDHDTPGRLGELREKRGNPGARAAAEADRDEREIRVANLIPQLLFCELGASLPDVRTTSRPHPPRYAAADEDLAVRLNGIEVYRIRVHDDGASPVDADPMEAMDGIAAGTPASDHEDPRPRGRERIEERLVPRSLCGLEAHP